MMNPLFDLVTPPDVLPELREPRFGALGAKWARWDGTHRVCEDCAQRIHERGIADAPAAMPARWRRKGPNGELFLCNVDAEERKRLDKQAEDVHAAREAQRAHAAKGRRR